MINAAESIKLTGNERTGAAKPVLKVFAAAALAVAGASVSTAAYAVEERTCLPFNEMVSTLRAEGQHTIVQGDKVGLDKGPAALVIYTSNDNGSRGYEVGGHRQADGQMPATLCVGATLANVQFHNVLEHSVPASWRLPHSLTPAQVKAEGERRGLTRTADYNRSLDTGVQDGFYPVLKANFIIDGRVSNGFLDVRMDSSDRVGASATVASNGFSWQTDTLNNMSYGQWAADQFQRRAQLAALTPRR